MTIKPLRPAVLTADSDQNREPELTPVPVNGETDRQTSITPSTEIAEPDVSLAVDAVSVEEISEESEEEVQTGPEIQPPTPLKPIVPGLRIGLQPGLRPGI